MSSPPLGKKFQCHNKVSESFAKFTRAVKKTPRRIANLLGSTRSTSHNKSFPDTTYASVNSLYECPCNYHLCQREELERRLASMVKPESYGVVSDHDIESESENGSVGDVETPAVERRMDESGKECLSTFEVNERAEQFIESFKEHQKHETEICS